MYKYSIFLFLFLSQLSLAQWKGPYEYAKFPSDALQGGYDLDGSPIYLGVVKHVDNKPVAEDDPLTNTKPKEEPKTKSQLKSKKLVWIAGKVREAYRGILYASGDKELYSKDYFLFFPKKSKSYEWVDAKDGEIPIGAVTIKGNERKVACRVKWMTGVYPGELNRGLKACEIGFAGARKRIYLYQVLVEK